MVGKQRAARRPLAFLVAGLGLLLGAVPAGGAGAADHVIHISVDGLHAEAVPVWLQQPGDAVPGFRRLREEGAYTDNARTDPFIANTLPNHASQITGRGVLGTQGHGWLINSDPDTPEPLTVHRLRGGYVPGVFDVVHDHGLSTALYAGKSKFAVFDRSWNAQYGADDRTGADDGRDKIDRYVYDGDMDALVTAFVAELAHEPANFSFLHLRHPDSTGHDSGWDLDPASEYMQAVLWVDRKLQQVFAAVDGSAVLRGRTALMVTADHSGELGTRTHFIARRAGFLDSGIVPFHVWGDGVGRGDLYALNVWRRFDPGDTLPLLLSFLAPVRNGDAANLALDLLGLPAVPGSTINARQDLRVAR